jgi:hypothetical protein
MSFRMRPAPGQGRGPAPPNADDIRKDLRLFDKLDLDGVDAISFNRATEELNIPAENKARFHSLEDADFARLKKTFLGAEGWVSVSGLMRAVADLADRIEKAKEVEEGKKGGNSNGR